MPNLNSFITKLCSPVLYIDFDENNLMYSIIRFEFVKNYIKQ